VADLEFAPVLADLWQHAINEHGAAPLTISTVVWTDHAHALPHSMQDGSLATPPASAPPAVPGGIKSYWYHGTCSVTLSTLAWLVAVRECVPYVEEQTQVAGA